VQPVAAACTADEPSVATAAQPERCGWLQKISFYETEAGVLMLELV
jgi:hypothetical protein